MDATTLSARPPLSTIPKARAAMWWLVASEIVIFGGAICCYLLYRLRHPEWAEQAGHTATHLGALNTFILLTSSLSVVLAHAAANRKEFKKAGRLILLTVLGGAAFLVVKGIEYSTEISHGFTMTSHLFWSFYYFMTGLHALHVIIGMVVLLSVLPGVKNGRHPHRAELAGIYWHLVDIIWIFLFPLLYIAQ